MIDVTRLSAASRRTLAAIHRSDAWLTASEIPGATAAALSLMAVRSDPWVERRRAVWGGEPGQKAGSGYEYRLTPRGREIAAAL